MPKTTTKIHGDGKAVVTLFDLRPMTFFKFLKPMEAGTDLDGIYAFVECTDGLCTCLKLDGGAGWLTVAKKRCENEVQVLNAEIEIWGDR